LALANLIGGLIVTNETVGKEFLMADTLELERFLPYRLSVLSNLVSRLIADLYEDRFDLKLPEWRVMAVLARRSGLTASEVAEATAMDKVAISRAVSRLLEMKRIVTTPDRTDGRRVHLALSAKGVAVYKEVAPLARSVEEALIAALPATEQDALDRILTRLTAAGRTLHFTVHADAA
jgi:DNA-binding MarR family transcriptional regulator